MSRYYRTLLATLQDKLLLDAFPNAAVAFSLRKLRKDYTGDCIEVRRSSDNATQDIGFLNGELDTASLLSFVGSGDGFVRTWYDQSGNNNHAFNTLNNSHPRIVSSGTIVINPDNIPSLDFTAGGTKLLPFTSGDTFKNKDYGVVFSVYQNSQSTRRDVVAFSTTSAIFGRFLLSDSQQTANRESISSRRLDTDSLSTTTATTNYSSSTRIVTGVVNWGNGSALVRRNGQLVGSNSSHGTSGFTSNTDSAINNSTTSLSSGIGNAFVTAPVQYISELILYNTNQDSNISGIETNINKFYNIY
jgi:hypothetical protein